MNCEESITGAYLSGRIRIPVPKVRRAADTAGLRCVVRRRTI